MRPVISCADAMRRLWEHLDQALPEAEADEVRRHIAECERCQPHAAFERRLIDEIAAVRPEHHELAALRDRIAAFVATRPPPADQRDG